MTQYVTHPVLTDPERAVILMQMSRAAYETWAELGGIEPNYDALSASEKERWGHTVRSATRVMFGVLREFVG